MVSLFTPNYGAASSHIAELTAERDDFIDANRTQAARIRHLEQLVASLKEDCAAQAEQASLQALIAESRARQLDEAAAAAAAKDGQIDKMRRATRLLWGTLTSLQQRASEQSSLLTEGNELLESLDAMLTDGAPSGEVMLASPA